jgi:hypothetical protein
MDDISQAVHRHEPGEQCESYAQAEAFVSIEQLQEPKSSPQRGGIAADAASLMSAAASA